MVKGGVRQNRYDKRNDNSLPSGSEVAAGGGGEGEGKEEEEKE